MSRTFLRAGRGFRYLTFLLGSATGSVSFRSWPGFLTCAGAWAVVLTALTFAGTAAALEGQRLLTGLTAEAGPEGVVLVWTVDETRADRIAGFSCVYRTPAHLRLRVDGVVPCERIPAQARGSTIAGLPEYGEDDAPGGPGIPWPLRALRVQVVVTEDLAGPAGPGRAVTGAGPLVESCDRDDGTSETTATLPWSLDDIVSAAHLTHYPRRGWTAGGDAAAPPDWPEPLSMSDLADRISDDTKFLRQELIEAGADAEKIAAVIASAEFEPVLAQAAAGTKALLRTGPDGTRELRLHSSYPFGADYVFEAKHAVPGWGTPTITWRRQNCGTGWIVRRRSDQTPRITWPWPCLTTLATSAA